MVHERTGGAQGARWRLAPILFGVVALIAVVTVTLRFSELGKLADLVRAARPEWLLAAAVAQALTYACATGVWRLSLDRAGYPLPLRELFPLGVARLFMDQMMIELSVAVSAFAMGAVGGAIGLVPLGLGTFEAAAIGALRLHGAPLEAALAATLLLRGFTTWLPMLPGLWIARRETAGERQE